MHLSRQLLLCAPLALATACGEEAGGNGEPQRTAVLEELPDIVLVTVDTLRADHLGCYGYHRDTSPTLDAVAREGVLFERAISTAGTTLPAHLTLMTGLYPHQHGYLANVGAVKARFAPAAGRRPVAEVLKEAGYATAAFVSGPTVSSHTGIDAGFDHFDQHEISDFEDVLDHSRPANETTARALAWLERGPSRPLFLWVHYWDPHEPNAPPEPYASMFPDDAGLEALIEERGIEPAALRARFSDVELCRLFAPELIRDLRAGRPVELPPIDRVAVRRLLNLYDGDVRHVDDSLRRLLNGLRAQGRWADSILVVTADHGQALGQHGWLEHGRIQLENTHVPLIMRFPPGLVPQPRREPRVVSLADVLPTVLSRLDCAPAREFLAQAEGEDLLAPAFERPYAFSQRSLRTRDWEFDEQRNGLKLALTLDGWRYYHRPDGPDELYDLTRDPGELRDVLAEHPERARKLRRIVGELVERRPYVPEGGGSSAAAQEYLDLLKAIGYAGDE